MALQQPGVVLPRVAFEVGERALPQIDSIIEFLYAGDLGRLVSRCRLVRYSRQIKRLRHSALERCSRNLARAVGVLEEEWCHLYGISGSDSEQVDQG